MHQGNFNQNPERRELKCTRAFYCVPVQIFSLTATLTVFFFAFSLFPQSASAIHIDGTYGHYANPAPVDIGSAADFLVIGKTAITGDLLSTFKGDIGVSPTAAAGLTLVTCANMIAGRMHTITAPATPVGCITTAATVVADNVKLSAATAAFDAAYLDARNQTTHPYDEVAGAVNISLAGVKGRGIYNYTGATSMATGLILRGSSTDIWIFQIEGAKTQAAAAQMVLQNEDGVVDGSNGPQASNIFWAINGAPSQGAGSHFVGVVIATGAISVGAGSTYSGRAFSNGAVTAATSDFYIGPDPQGTLVTVEQTITASTFFSFPSFAPLSTTGGSGSGAVSFAVTTAGTAGCSIVGTSTLLYLSGGTCTVTATKADDTYYLEATSIPATFTVNLRTKGTTITNQGTGTYSFNVASGTLNASYYEITNTDIYGLNISNTPTISDLSKGVYALTTANGTAITLSSTTIDADPGKQIYDILFATTTAIAANNVTQTDGAPASYWWFREGLGNMYGETKDNDTGDPGSVRFDDSSLVITVSGVVYEDDETTPMNASVCDGSTQVVRVVVENGASTTGSCAIGTGAFSIGGVVVVGDPTLTTYLDTDGGVRGVTITKTPTADITDLDIYENHVTTRHEDVSALTIDDMTAFDYNDDDDVGFIAATGTPDTLVIMSGNELHIASTTTFDPQGSVTVNGNALGSPADGTLHIDNNATFIGYGTTTISLAGSFLMDDGATFTRASTTVLMNATTSGKTITTTATQEIYFNELIFNGSGGAWNLNGDIRVLGNIDVTAGTVTGTGDITLTNGSISGNGLLSLGGGTTTIEVSNTLGGTQAWTFYNLALGNGSVVGTTAPTSTATTTVSGVLTIDTAHFLDAGNSNWNLSGSGNVFVEEGTFLEDTSSVTYSGTAATSILSTDYYNLTLNALAGSPTYTAVGAGIQAFNNFVVGNSSTTTVNFDTNDSALNIDGDMTIGTLGTFIASNSGSFTLAGSYDNNGTYTASGGLLTFDGASTHTIAAGNSSFATAEINGTGDFTIIEHATATTAFTLTAANDFTVNSGVILAVGGTFINSLGDADTIWTDSILSLYGGGDYEINGKTISDTYGTLVVAAGTQIRMWNSSAATTTVSTTGYLYSMDHADMAGVLYVYGVYANSDTTDYWSYATDFDGTALGGSPRIVDVFVESGGSMMYNGTGNLQMVGVAAASTTVQNQGSGTYSFTIGDGATANFTYYTLRDTDIDGLVLTGAPTVTTLSRGDFLVDVNNGSAITVGGTAITANPAKTFIGNSFASSSGVLATNVTATGTAVSSWRFTVHSGNIAGEAFDVDPGGDPGYVAWVDSLGGIVISGNVYSDEGASTSFACDSSTDSITLVVGGILADAISTSCAGDGAGGGTGAYSMPAVGYTTGDSLVVYIDGVAQVGANVTVDPVSGISDMDIYENRVIVRHEDVNPMSIADMAVWDSSDDVDIPFTAVTGTPDTLTLPADTKLIVWTNKEFEPIGNVTLAGGGAGAAYDGTLELSDGGDWTSNAGESHSIGGGLISGTGSVFDANTSTFTFTTAGAARTIDTNDASFNDVIFNGSGSWTITNTTFDANDVTITAGTTTLPSATTTISGSLNNTGGTFDANGGIMIFDSTAAETIRASSSDFAVLTINGSGSFTMQDINATATASVTVEGGTLTLPSGTFAIGGDFRNVGGTVTHNTSDLIFTNVTSATLLASNSDLYGVIFNGGGAYAMEDNSLSLLGSLTVANGSLTLASGTLSLGGSLDAVGGTFDNATGTILFNSGDTGETIDPGASPFYNVNISNGAGGWTIISDATTTNNFTLSTASSFTLGSGNVLTVQGVFTNSIGGSATTWLGSTLNLESGTEYEINAKATGGDNYETLVIDANTDISAWNSSATTTTVASNGSFYSQDNAAVDGALFIYGDYHISITTEYWSYATDFDGTALGGSPRAVTVALAGNATTTVDGGTLNIIGISTDTATITNQGSGTYSFNVSSGTFNAQYYAYRNLDAAGLNLTNTPTISSLDNGNFELAVAGGNLISLSATTLNANASKVIVGVRFATTTAITGDNVDLSGTTASAWTFLSHTGNLDGEDYDNDGGDACGSIRWSDSACLLTQQTHYRWRNDDGGIGVQASEWFDIDWDARKRVRVENADNTTYSNGVFELTVAYDADMQADFDDLRFTDDTGVTEIPYFIASTTNSVSAEVWVQVPTLPALDTATVFMYYNNGAAITTSSSTETFIVADDFEDGNISEYSGDTGLFTVDGIVDLVVPAYGGSYQLDNTGNESANAIDGIAHATAAQVVSQGEIIRYMQYVNTGTGDEVCTMFGVQLPVTANNNYAVCFEQVGTDRISLAQDVERTDSFGASVQVLASSTVTFSDGWYEVEIDWQTDDTIDVYLYDDTGSLVATTSANNTSYSSGGFGFTFWFNSGGWDNFTSRVRVDTEPTIRFGAEQSDGGATWAAALDTQSSYSQGDVARLRIAVENTGLPITNQTFDVEYAAKGASPSCEAVSGGSYTIVPPQASCGSSPICMQTSANVTDGGVTTDLLFDTEGDFTAGEVVESPSNTTGNIDIDPDEYIEVEYVVIPTVNATDPSYCLRVTDAGATLDTYLSVAELQLLFNPSFGIVYINNQEIISLVGGVTTRVYATSTVSDGDGYADLVAGTSTMYTTAATAACAADNNDCYISTTTAQCSFTNCSGNACLLECYADFYYHADPTDMDGGEEWFAFMEVEDTAGGYGFGTSIGTELMTLRYAEADSVIAYGSIEVESNSAGVNASTTIFNLGNVPIDVDVDGTDLSDGAASTIAVAEQKFATTTFTYSACVACTALDTIPVNYELDLLKPTTTAMTVEDEIYWGINVPFGTANNPHTGAVTFTPISD
jgi:hypothetical protein